MAILTALLALGHAPPHDPGIGGGGSGPVDAFDALGTVRAIDNGTSAADLNGVLGAHRAALLQVRGDLQRTHERIERMVPEAQALFRKAQSEARAEWVPNGDAARMDARYIGEDGSVRFRRGVAKVRMPDGTEEETVVQGLLTDPYTVTVEQERARRAYAGYALAFVRASGPSSGGRSPFGDKLVRKAFLNLRDALMALPGRTGDFCRRMFGDAELYKRVINGTAGQGGELLQVPTISEVRRPTDMARRIPGLVQVVPVVSSSFKQPIITGRALAKRRGATTDDPARYPVRRFTTSDVTITVVDQELTALVDPLWSTDAGQVLGDPMGVLMDWLEMGWMDTLEMAFLHGDTAGTHQDAIASWTMGGLYTAGDLDGSASPLKFWLGFRARAFDDSATVSGGGTFDIADHFGALELMGNLAAEAVAITGWHCLYTQLLPNSAFTTVDKMGALATQVTGELGKLGKTPIILSEGITNDLANTGLYTGSGTTTGIVYVNPTRYKHYDHQGGSDGFDVTYPERGAQYVGEVRRSVLAPDCLATEKPAAVLYNL